MRFTHGFTIALPVFVHPPAPPKKNRGEKSTENPEKGDVNHRNPTIKLQGILIFVSFQEGYHIYYIYDDPT